MLNIVRTNSDNTDFLNLITHLDQYLRVLDGEDHSFFAQFNKVDHINHVIVIYQDNLAIACGAIKEYEVGTMEVKRMFTSPAARGRGIASTVLKELEQWSLELGYTRCILEMGKLQTQAEILYRKNNYTVIPNYGQYEGVESSLCFEKLL
ncbi:GNAT family N-acetyltransferase [Myroides marinus]|uniref:GNAT family N-acetyltransferase n=1 Tax=Myroides marinus TaxID=703342 RepID=UPI002577D461|nr:GNAT family N-acetyltransferase [Myroides marinus]MDM1378562.1 GNAT family N-acetyltransferase [Myroides marinus]MDM1385833.1 GNAT family N-acetyltransferase [Myroides marinus]MDM1393046.1 GNAT family N-acetyltransferase [Myroides marinus]